MSMPGDLVGLARSWRATVSNLQDLLEQQKDEIAKLSQSWTGESGDAFRQEQESWQKQVDALLAAAYKISDILSIAADSLIAIETGVANNPSLGGGG